MGKERSWVPASQFPARIPNSWPRNAGAEGRRGSSWSPCDFRTLPHLVCRAPAPSRSTAGSCAPRAKEGVAQRSPGSLLPRGTDARPAAPPGRPGHFAPSSRQRESAYPNPNAAPVICQSPCSRLPGNRS